MTVWKDPIVEAVRKARKQVARESGGSLAAIVAAARRREKTSGHPVVSFVAHTARRSPRQRV